MLNCYELYNVEVTFYTVNNSVAETCFFSFQVDLKQVEFFLIEFYKIYRIYSIVEYYFENESY